MAVSVADAPYEGSFTVVGQPLVYRFSSSTAMGTKKYSVRVKQNGTEIATYLLTPNEADDAFFDLNTLAENLVEAPESVGTNPIHSSNNANRVFKTPSVNGCVKFGVAVAEYDGGTTGGYTADSEVLLLPGNFTTAEGQPSLTQFMIQFNMGDDGENQQTFMSEVPSVVDAAEGHQTTWYMSTEDEGVSHFMYSSTFANTDASVRLAMSVQNDTGGVLDSLSTTLVSTLMASSETTSDPQRMHCVVQVGPKNIASLMSWTENTLTNWDQILIYLRSNGANEEYGWLLIKRADVCHKAQIAWVNKYGSWDYIGFSGFTNETMNTKRKTIMKRLGDWNSANDYAAYAHSRVNDVYRVTGTTQYTLTKVFDSAQDALLLESCQRSRKHMVRIGDDWFPVVLDTGSIRVERSPRAKAPQVTLKCTLAQPVLC